MRNTVSGRWVRRGNMIVVDGVGPGVSAVDSEFGFPFSAFFPAKQTGAGVSPASLPVPLFPPTPSDPLVTDSKMTGALMNAVHALEKAQKLQPDTLPVR